MNYADYIVSDIVLRSKIIITYLKFKALPTR